MAVYYSYFPIVEHTNENIRNIMLRARIADYVKANPKVFLPYVVEDDLRAEDVAAYYYGSVEYVWLIYWANNIIDPYTDWVMNDEDFHKYLYKKYLPTVKQYYVDLDYVDPDYTEEREPTFQEVIEFTQNNTLTENIVEFRRYDDESITMRPETFYLTANLQTGEGVPVYTSRDDGISALEEGDLYFDEVLGVYYVWTNNNWVRTENYNIPYMIHSEWYAVRYYDWELERNENNRHIEVVDKIYLNQILSELKEKLND